MSDTEKEKPALEVKAGSVKAAIWANSTTSGTRYNVTFQRVYKKDDAWKTTQSFGERDLADVARAAILAEAWIREQTADRAA